MNDAPSSSSLLPGILLILVIVIVVCMALALIAIPIVGLVVLGRKKKTANKHFAQVAASLGSRTRCSVFNDTYSMQGHHHHVPYELRYHGGNKWGGGSSSGSITIVVPVEPSFTLSLREENWDTNVSKKIGMATELEIGVPDFDAEFFMQTKDPTSCRNFLSVPKHRAAIRHIYQQGYTLTFTRNQMELRKDVKNLMFADNGEIVEEAEIKGVLDVVVVLVKGL